MEAAVLVQDSGVARPASRRAGAMRTMTFGLPVAWPLVVAVLGMSVAAAQKTQNEPATDSAAQSSPIQATPHAPVTDSAAEASPIQSTNGTLASIAPHTAINLKL